MHDETLEICCHVDSDLRALMCVVLTRVLSYKLKSRSQWQFQYVVDICKNHQFYGAVRQIDIFLSECRLLYIGFSKLN